MSLLFRLIMPAFVTLAFLASCAPKKETVKKAPEPPPPVEEKLVLPEPPLPPGAVKSAAEEQKKTQPFFLEEDSADRYIILNFEDTDIRTVIDTFAELLDMNYILTPGISGTVTIQSYKKFPVRDLFSIFQSILEINGLTSVKDGSFYRILPIDAAKQQPVDIEKGQGIEYGLNPTFITQIVPLQFIKASDIKNIIANLSPRGTDIIVYEPANMLIVSALPQTLKKFMKIIEALDISETERETVRTFVYYVENGEAKKLADLIKGLFGEKKESSAVDAAAIQRRLPTGQTAQASTATLPGEVGELSIIAYEDINALIIKCSSQTFLSLLEVLKKLDVPVKQVLIEVLIAEISMTDKNEFGIQWLLEHSAGDTTGFINPGTTITDRKPSTLIDKTGQPGGFAHLVTESNISAIMTALASQSRLNVLASPHILTMDNKEARIEIGDEIPIATGLTQQPATAAAGTTLVTSGQIQYKTVGTILAVTPHITEKNMVTLRITQESSSLGVTVKVAGQDFQGFSKRKAETTAAIQSEHTLVLGGLIRETKNVSRAGVPILSKIPILGYLFSANTISYDRTELILMVTPRVITTQAEADSLAGEFQERIKVIKEKLGKETNKKPAEKSQ